MKINEKLLDTLNKQVTAEHEAALIYQQLAYELDALSFSGMSTWMAAQADEERVHAGKIADHILARGEHVQLSSIEIPELQVSSALDAFAIALEHEQKVSDMIRNLARVADEVQDFDSRTLVNWFLNEQIEEEDTVGGIIDQLKMVGEDGAGLLRIDARLGAEREPAAGPAQ
ncbi:ferritin [Corynebacterium sp.]|uniref:ferritin n=1 Tax=Corynebacterium sp. TaxID=1720 RepID=UPI0026E0F008|nr:ferritin [Corynebacterium sp.]MDO5512800.1 ferritin [Corynebacterium sp.]